MDEKCSAWWLENFLKQWDPSFVAIYQLEIGYPISYSSPVDPWSWYETYPTGLLSSNCFLYQILWLSRQSVL
jgi:hypothetical protein